LVDETARLREKLNETIAEIDKKYATKNGLALFGLDDESIRIIEDKLRHVSDLWGSLIDIRANREDKELQDFRLRSEKQIEILENQRERGYLTDEKFEAKKKELQDKVDAQALKVRQKQAKREKALAMFNAAINTASAVSQINANPAVNLDVTQTLRGLLTGLVLATGLAQQAAIASQPIPAFAKGVLNFKGGRALVGEEGPELVTLPAGSNVFPAPVTADIARMVDAFTGNNSNTNAPSVSSSNNSNTPDNNFDNSNNDTMMQMMLKLMGLISDPENRRAIIVRDDLTEFDQQTKFLQDFGSLKRVG
jgi:SLT domain-containing protein